MTSKPAPTRPKLRVRRKKARKPPRRDEMIALDPRPQEDLHHKTMRTVFEGGAPGPGYHVAQVAKVEMVDGRIVQTLRPVRSAPDASLDWHQQRRQWNSEGFCAQAACHHQHQGRKHPDSGLLYCDRTADDIEAACSDVGLKLPRAEEP
jgi:hypothetical protein